MSNNTAFKERLLQTLNIMVPKDKIFSRIGSASDGGYVTVNDFSSNDYLISFGVEDNVDFEEALSHIVSGIDLYDNSVDTLPISLNNSRFYKEEIGSTSKYVFDRAPAGKDLVLKSDIEGAEWSFFESLSTTEINKFRQIIIEVHWATEKYSLNSIEKNLDILEKINTTHQIVSLHPNNCADIYYANGIAIPEVIELTFLRKFDYNFVDGKPPAKLFSANNPKRIDLEFDVNKKYKEVYDHYLGYVAFPFYDKLISQSIDKDGVWNENEFYWMIENVKEGDVCINVGSNVGYFTSVMSKKVGRWGRVFSIEANPEFEYLLKENIKRANMNNVSLIMSAAGNTSGTVDLFINSDNCGNNHVFDPDIIKESVEDKFLDNKIMVSVAIDKVDNLVVSEKVDLVVIDCQGWDHEVVRGMNSIIQKNKPKILVEFVPKWIKALGEDPLQILKEYQDLGYDLLCPDLDIHQSAEPIDIIDLIDSSDRWYVNIYLSPKKEQGMIMEDYNP